MGWGGGQGLGTGWNKLLDGPEVMAGLGSASLKTVSQTGIIYYPSAKALLIPSQSPGLHILLPQIYSPTLGSNNSLSPH